MPRKIAFIGLLALMLSIPAVAADFSGSYNLQRGDATLVVSHNGADVSFTHTRTDRDGQQRVTSFTYVTDGTERTVAGLRGENRSVNAIWQNDATLVVQTNADGRRTTETWTLEGDTLKLEIVPQNPRRGFAVPRTIVFQR